VSSEIPVVLKPQGFAETKQGADAAAGSLANLGTKVVSLEKLGEVAKKIGPAALAMTAIAFAAREAGQALDAALGGTAERARAAAASISAVREAIQGAKTAALDSGRSGIAGNGPVLAQAAGAGVSTQDAAAVAKKYGVSIDEARKALVNGGDLEAASALRIQTGEGLDSASSKLFKQFRGAKVGANGVSAILAQSGQFTSPSDILRAKDAAEADPLSRKQRELNAANVDKQVDLERRGLESPAAKARSPELGAALETFRKLQGQRSALDTEESQLARNRNAGGFLERIYNFQDDAAALGNIDRGRRSIDGQLDGVMREIRDLMKGSGIRTQSASRDAAAQ
jgi:NACalpha-BTF3-like transcription factor